jgi:hypothetical protein
MKHLFIKQAAAIIVLLLGTGSQVQAGKIFLLLAADTSYESKIALSTGPDLGYMFDVFFAHVPENQLFIYNFGGDNGWEGPDLRFDLGNLANKMLKAIDNCPAGPNDTIIFFYSGHGATEKRSGKHFLLMPDGKTSLSRQTIINRIKRKRPRLAVVMTDSCSELVDRGMLPGPRMMLIPPERIVPLFDELFVRPKGLVDFNSATEGQIAAGPIGGGLMTLAMAHIAGKPKFQGPKRGGATTSVLELIPKPVAQPGVEIPSVDFDQIIDERFGGSVFGGNAGFNPNVPPYGFLWRNAKKRLSWATFKKGITRRVDELYREVNPKGRLHQGKLQKTQTPQFYSMPKTTRSSGGGQTTIKWSEPIYRPEVNDRIISVNGNKVSNLRDFVREVKGSPQLMTFQIIDNKSGKRFRLRTRLNPPTAKSRLGIVVVDDSRPGIHVKHVRANQPGTRCQIAQ